MMGVQPQAPTNPIDMMANVMGVREKMAQLQDAQRQRAEIEELRRIYQEVGIDPQKRGELLQRVARVNPMMAEKLRAEWTKEQITEQSAQMKALVDRANVFKAIVPYTEPIVQMMGQYKTNPDAWTKGKGLLGGLARLVGAESLVDQIPDQPSDQAYEMVSSIPRWGQDQTKTLDEFTMWFRQRTAENKGVAPSSDEIQKFLATKQTSQTGDPWMSKTVLRNGKPVIETRKASEWAAMGGVEAPMTTAQIQSQTLPADWTKAGEAFVQSLRPEDQRLVRGLASYMISADDVFTGNRVNDRERYLKAVLQVNPNYDSVQAKGRVVGKREFIAGQKGRSITSLNTAIAHMGKLKDASEALSQGDAGVQSVNRFVNWARNQFGSDKVTNYATAMTAVVDEAAAVFKATGATDVAIQAWKETAMPYLTKGQFEGQQKTLVDLLEGRFRALNADYLRAMGYKDVALLSPDSHSTLQRFGVDTSTWEDPSQKNSISEAMRLYREQGMAPKPIAVDTEGNEFEFLSEADRENAIQESGGLLRPVDEQPTVKPSAASPATSDKPPANPKDGQVWKHPTWGEYKYSAKLQKWVK